MQMGVFRLTTAGTGGGTSAPPALDTTDAACGATAMTLPTGKGTEGALLWAGGVPIFNPVTSPGVLMGVQSPPLLKPIRIPAGTANGIAVKNITAVAGGSAALNIYFFEANY